MINRNQVFKINDVKSFANLDRLIIVFERYNCGRYLKERTRTDEYILARCNYCSTFKRVHLFANTHNTKISNYKLIILLYIEY